MNKDLYFKFEEATLYLFSGLPIGNKPGTRIPSENLLAKTLKRGFVFSPVVCAAYPENVLYELASKIGVSGEEANSSFHKSWEKIATASIYQLVVEQLLHYFSTYGVEFLTGEEHPEMVYIPWEELNIPEQGKLQLKIIHGYTVQEIHDLAVGMLSSGIALKEKTLDAVLTILEVTPLTIDEVDSIKNREAQIVLYDSLGIIPKNPEIFFRYLIYKVTGQTMVIKNKKMRQAIQQVVEERKVKLLQDYVDAYGTQGLAQIFYRYKPLWLAFKNSQTRTIINRIRKEAVKYHVPVQPQLLDRLSSTKPTYKNLDKASEYLLKATIWRKLRILQALNFRLTPSEHIIYKVRNGRMFVTGLERNNPDDLMSWIQATVIAITAEIGDRFMEKKFYIPKGIRYGLPTTEKQFVGNFPAGTSVTVGDDMIIGIWWKNNGRRIDLDFSVQTLHGKYGWDASYRSGSRNVLFSGDVTDAHNGASELFYLGNAGQESMQVNLNYFNHVENNPVQAKLFLAKENVKQLPKNYMVNPANIVVDFPLEITEKQNVLGFITPERGELTYYFMDAGFGNSITAVNSKHTVQAITYMEDYYKNAVSLNGLISAMGGILVENPQDADVDLSVEKLTKDTFLSLFK